MFRRMLVFCVLLVAIVGCQQRATTVTGKVTLDGKPLAIGSDSRGTVIFQPAGGQGSIATGLLDPIGHFQLATGASTEIAPGKYDVAVSVARLLPPSDQAEQGAERVTPAKYASTSDSGLTAEVAPGENRVSFDLVSSADEESGAKRSEP